jgi:hypothetical protein
MFCLVLVIVVAGFVGYAAYQGRGLDASSKAYVEENIPAIVSTWSKDELLKRSSPQLLKAINEKPGQLDQLFQKLSALGPMVSFGEVKGDSNVTYTTQNGHNRCLRWHRKIWERRGTYQRPSHSIPWRSMAALAVLC